MLWCSCLEEQSCTASLSALCRYGECPRPPAGGANLTLHGPGAADPVGAGAVAPPLGSGEHMEGQTRGGVLQRDRIHSLFNQALICLNLDSKAAPVQKYQRNWGCMMWAQFGLCIKLQNKYCSVDHNHWCCVSQGHFSPDGQWRWLELN